MKSEKNRPPAAQHDISTRAIEWLMERQEGFAPGRAGEFRAWCAADPRHAQAVAKAERTLVLLGELPDLKEPLGARLAQEEAAGLQRRRFTRPLWIAAGLAAAVALVVSVWWRPPAIGPEDVNYMSNSDRPQQLVLDDGSFVDLNARTTIRTEMKPNERRISLREGEAHFAVAHDPARPFIVEVGGIAVRAVGTAFNVRLVDDRVEVLVLEGRVELSSLRAAVSPISPQLGVAERVVVAPQDDLGRLPVQRASEHEISEAVAWHSTVTTISSRPLREIVELFNRRNRLQLVIADPELADRNFGGSFSIDQPETFLRLLELEGDLIAQPHGPQEMVLRRKP